MVKGKIKYDELGDEVFVPDETKDELKNYQAGHLMKNYQRSQKRIMLGIPMTGLLRSEWVLARYGQVIPCNWSMGQFFQYVDQYSPLQYTVADARNIIVQEAVKQGYEWLFFIDHDVVLPPATILHVNDRMNKADIPVWSGLYWTQSRPSEPIIYRGRGNSYYKNWKLGERVWVDGIPMGCTLIHVSILKVMYEDSEEYMAGQVKVRRVFKTPGGVHYDPQTRAWFTAQGTEDLEWCTRVMEGGYLKKAGWEKFQRKKWPFLMDTSVFCRHIDWDGIQFPAEGEESNFVDPKDVGKEIK
jgi:hypothetical protein